MARSSSRRIGVMGGTFDPIHMGHLVTADEARHAFALDEVIFVPAGRPWQKEAADVSTPEDRYRMTLIATAADPGFGVSRVEIERDGPSYAIDTLRALKAAHRGAELFFITGADAILQILTWKDPGKVLAEARFIAATRPGYDLERLEKELPEGLEERVITLEIPALAISSTDIRRRVGEGRPIAYLVPPGIAAYIQKAGLYR